MLGGLLIAVTVLLIGGVVRLVALDVWEDAVTDDAEHEVPPVVTNPEPMAEEEAGSAITAEHTSENAVGLEMTTLVVTEPRSGGPPPSTGEEGTAAVSSSRLIATSPEGNFLLGMLCGEESSMDDTAALVQRIGALVDKLAAKDNKRVKELLASKMMAMGDASL